MKARNILEITDFSQPELLKLIRQTIQFKNNPRRAPSLLKGKRLGLVFDSNSLRTRLSFESAMHLLGGTTYFINVEDIIAEKDGTPRESFEDIIETMDRMVDVYVVRDYSQNMFTIFKRKAYPPFINGFCQVGHPSQALTDLAVVTWKKKRYQKLKYVGVCPSTGSGVMESFIYGVLLLGQHFTLITPTGKFIGKNKDFKSQITRLANLYGGSLVVTKDVSGVIPLADVLYVDEWWENNPNYLNRNIGKYRVNKHFLNGAKPTLSIMHCMPVHAGREIALEVMRSTQSIIYDEAEFRTYAAMALLSYLKKSNTNNNLWRKSE